MREKSRSNKTERPVTLTLTLTLALALTLTLTLTLTLGRRHHVAVHRAVPVLLLLPLRVGGGVYVFRTLHQ